MLVHWSICACWRKTSWELSVVAAASSNVDVYIYMYIRLIREQGRGRGIAIWPPHWWVMLVTLKAIFQPHPINFSPRDSSAHQPPTPLPPVSHPHFTTDHRFVRAPYVILYAPPHPPLPFLCSANKLFTRISFFIFLAIFFFFPLSFLIFLRFLF